MQREELGDPVRAPVRVAVGHGARQNGRVRQHGAMSADAALNVAQHELAAGLVVGVVRERLHCLGPVGRVVIPAGVAIPCCRRGNNASKRVRNAYSGNNANKRGRLGEDLHLS